MKIEITQDHIDRALGHLRDPKQWIHNTCPIAIALHDLGYVDIDVGSKDVLCRNPYSGMSIARYALDEEGMSIVELFDAGEDVSPSYTTLTLMKGNGFNNEN